MVLGDLAEVAAVWHRTKEGAFPWMGAELRHTMRDDLWFLRHRLLPGSRVWVAVRGFRIQGFLALRKRHIEQLFVDTIFQGMGVGTALLDAAKAQEPAGLTLHTHCRNAAARSFYRAQGFEPRKHGRSPPPENLPDVLFQWRGGR